MTHQPLLLQLEVSYQKTGNLVEGLHDLAVICCAGTCRDCKSGSCSFRPRSPNLWSPFYGGSSILMNWPNPLLCSALLVDVCFASRPSVAQVLCSCISASCCSTQPMGSCASTDPHSQHTQLGTLRNDRVGCSRGCHVWQDRRSTCRTPRLSTSN